MVQHYSPKTFLRQTSNAILQACFEKQGVLKDVPWNGLPEHQIDVVYDQWQDLPESQRDRKFRGEFQGHITNY